MAIVETRPHQRRGYICVASSSEGRKRSHFRCGGGTGGVEPAADRVVMDGCPLQSEMLIASRSELRELGPVISIDQSSFLLTRHHDVEDALSRPEIFRSRGRVDVGNVRPRIPVDIDPPEHAKYRRILDPLFSRRSMEALDVSGHALAIRLLDGFAGHGRCDFASDFAVPWPCLMFLNLLGTPDARPSRTASHEGWRVRPALILMTKRTSVKWVRRCTSTSMHSWPT